MLASTFGAFAGLGGGVIIKPVLDTFNHYDVSTIGILSASTVLSMATISLLSSVKSGVEIKVAYSMTIAIGSAIGGIFGKLLFNQLIELTSVSESITAIQAGIIALLMVLILLFFRSRRKVAFHITNKGIILLIGIVLGLLAAFLGIGGGPFNVAILVIFFSMRAKEAAFNSIFIIFFSQLSSLLYTTFSTGFSHFDLTMLPFMIFGGVIGGLLGSKLVRKVDNRYVSNIFMIGLIGMVFINLYNIAKYMI